MNSRKVFGVYKNEEDVSRAVQNLLDMGYAREDISIVSKDGRNRIVEDSQEIAQDEILRNDVEPAPGDPQVVRDTELESATAEGFKGGAATGATIGGVAGLLAGLGALAIPGIGPIVAAGPIAAALGGALAGGTVGGTLGVLGGALVDAGVPEEDARYIDERFQEGDIIVYVDTDEENYERATKSLNYDMESHRVREVDQPYNSVGSPEEAYGADPQDRMAEPKSDRIIIEDDPEEIRRAEANVMGENIEHRRDNNEWLHNEGNLQPDYEKEASDRGVVDVPEEHEDQLMSDPENYDGVNPATEERPLEGSDGLVESEGKIENRDYLKQQDISEADAPTIESDMDDVDRQNNLLEYRDEERTGMDANKIQGREMGNEVLGQAPRYQPSYEDPTHPVEDNPGNNKKLYGKPE